MSLFNYECDEIKRKIQEVSPNYPQLITYESEWLYFHENHYTPGTPVELEYERINVNPAAIVLNAIPHQCKSAIIKGYTDENLQSVIAPVLTATGKNLLDPTKVELNVLIGTSGAVSAFTGSSLTDYIFVEQGKTYYNPKGSTIGVFDMNKNFISRTAFARTYQATQTGFIRWNLSVVDGLDTLQVEEGTAATTFEAFHSNILTCNEDVILRSSGDVYDELDLLTGRLTQRIGENNEVLAQAIVRKVDLTPLTEPFEGYNRYYLTANIPCEAILEVPIVSAGEQTLEEINN